MLTTASSPAAPETIKAILRPPRRTLTVLHSLHGILTAVPLRLRHTQLQGILVISMKIIWYIAKPSSTAAPGYYLASDGNRK
jgi:hypothetical protein